MRALLLAAHTEHSVLPGVGQPGRDLRPGDLRPARLWSHTETHITVTGHQRPERNDDLEPSRPAELNNSNRNKPVRCVLGPILSPGTFTVANVCWVHIGVDVVGDIVLSPLLPEDVLIVVKIFNLVYLSLVRTRGGGRQVLFLLRLTNSPLFSFLDEPVLVVIFYFAFLSLPRLFWFLVGGRSCRGCRSCCRY